MPKSLRQGGAGVPEYIVIIIIIIIITVIIVFILLKINITITTILLLLLLLLLLIIINILLSLLLLLLLYHQSLGIRRSLKQVGRRERPVPGGAGDGLFSYKGISFSKETRGRKRGTLKQHHSSYFPDDLEILEARQNTHIRQLRPYLTGSLKKGVPPKNLSRRLWRRPGTPTSLLLPYYCY